MRLLALLFAMSVAAFVLVFLAALLQRIFVSAAGGVLAGLGGFLVLEAGGLDDEAAIGISVLAGLCVFILLLARRTRERSPRVEARSRLPEPGDWLDAWRSADRQAGFRARERVALARAACDRLLDAAEAHEVDLPTQEFIDAMRKRLPEQVAIHAKARAGATKPEQALDREKLLTLLGNWAENAERHRQTIRRSMETEMDVAHRYTSSRGEQTPP